MFKKCFTHIIMVTMATYVFQSFCEKWKFFKSSPFYKIIFKARIKQNISGMFKKCFMHIIMVAMATYPHPNFCEKWKKNQIKPIFAYYFKARIKQNISGMFKKCFTHIIMVALATYPQSPQFLWKMKLFKSSPFFLLLFLKQELKKKSRMLYKMFYTYYHGCHGNIPPPPCFKELDYTFH